MTATTDPAADGDGERTAAGPHRALPGRVSLADAVTAVRDELLEAAARAHDQDLLFEVGPIQMEFTAELRREARADGRLKAWVLEAGADAGRTSGHTHRVAFTLTPRRGADSGEPLLVGNDDLGSLDGFGGAGA
jgi:hypothetical protein